jgi:hypothetical protein
MCKVKNIGPTFITIETEGNDIFVVLPRELSKTAPFAKNPKFQFGGGMETMTPPVPVETNTPAIHFSPTFKIINGGSDNSKESNTTPAVTKEETTGGTIYPVSEEKKEESSSGGTSPQPIDFNRLQIKKLV